MPTTLNIAVPASSSTAPLGYAMPDPVLRYFGPDKGFCFDLKSADCFSRQANPVSGDALVNYSNVAATRNGVITQTASGITFAGNGLDLTNVVAPGNFVAVANAFEAIQADTNKEWMSIYWVKMPVAADWPATGRSISAAGNYSSAADLFTLYMVTNTGSKDLIIRPQTAVGSATAINCVNAGTTFSGKVVQIFVYRTAAGVTTVRIKASDSSATYTSTPVTLATNSATLSGLTWRFGTMDTTQSNQNFNASGSWAAIDIGACKWRLYRALVQSTKGLPSTVTPLAIADADFADTVARAVYT